MKPDRVEVIDHRKNAPDLGRIPSEQIELSWQDNDKTLKIFINDKSIRFTDFYKSLEESEQSQISYAMDIFNEKGIEVCLIHGS